MDEISAVAIDGKEIRNASKQRGSGDRARMVAAVEQDSGVVPGQEAVAPDSDEIPAVRALIGRLDLAGRVVTLDAWHARQETARLLVEEGRAAYIAIIKENQGTILDDLENMDFCACPTVETVDKEHGRSDTRRYWFQEITDPGWDGYADLHGRTIAIRSERTRHVVRSGKTTVTVTYALTSLPPERVTPQQLAAMLRHHWHIENRLHSVRDFSYDEDRCRVSAGDLPRNLAALSNTAISIVRCQTDFPLRAGGQPPFLRARAGSAGPDLQPVRCLEPAGQRALAVVARPASPATGAPVRGEDGCVPCSRGPSRPHSTPPQALRCPKDGSADRRTSFLPHTYQQKNGPVCIGPTRGRLAA